MIVILLQKIFETLVNSFTTIKTKLTTLYENIEPPTPPAPAVVIDKLVTAEKIYDSTSKTVAIPDISSYEYLYIYLWESQLSYKDAVQRNCGRCIKVSDIGENTLTFRMGYLWDSTNVYISLTKNSISCTYSYNNITQFVDVIGTNEQIF